MKTNTCETIREQILSGAIVSKDSKGRVLCYDDASSDMHYTNEYHPNGRRSTYKNSNGFQYWFNSDGKMTKSIFPSGLEYYYSYNNEVWKVVNHDKTEEIFDDKHRLIYRGRTSSEKASNKSTLDAEYWVYNDKGKLTLHLDTSDIRKDKESMEKDILLCKAHLQSVLKQMSRSGYIPKA